jgi:hypothetical protein
MKKGAPSVKVATGGLVVAEHHAAKPGFSRRVYSEGAPFFDVAAFHAHDSFDGYKRVCSKLKSWLPPGKPFGNTEAGYRSYHAEPLNFFKQAAALVQKISYTKSVGGEFYIWFMLHDYWDKYIDADDSFGLVTVDNQPKPSFLAYNELIRQLANLQPAKENFELDARLESYRFAGEGEELFVCWPRRPGEPFSFCLKASAPLMKIDIFGNESLLEPAAGVVFADSENLPFYLRGKEGSLSPAPALLSVVGGDVLAPGERGSLKVKLVNIYGTPVDYSFSGSIAAAGRLQKDAETIVEAPVEAPAGALPMDCSATVSLEVKSLSGAKLRSGSIALPWHLALPVRRFGQEPAELAMDGVDSLTELAFDPNTPRWSGPEDLSARFSFSWDERHLRFRCDVRDQDWSHSKSGSLIWLNDCVQLAFANLSGEQSELTVACDASGEPKVWRHISPAGVPTGELALPVKISRSGDIVSYELSIPFEDLKIKHAPGAAFRASVLVNDADAGKRLRVMQWNGGIEGSKSVALMGWAVLK